MLLISVRGLQRLGSAPALAVIGICVAQFAVSLIRPQGGWDWINGSDPQGRATVEDKLNREAGDQLVFVHYSPVHGFAEWVHNRADINGSRVVWAHDLGTIRDRDLMQRFPDRTAWLLFPDETPPRLAPFPKETSPFEQVQ